MCLSMCEHVHACHSTLVEVRKQLWDLIFTFHCVPWGLDSCNQASVPYAVAAEPSHESEFACLVFSLGRVSLYNPVLKLVVFSGCLKPTASSVT